MAIAFELLGDSHLAALVALNRAQYGEDFFTNQAYFRWRFFSDLNPGSFLVGAFDNGKLVGATGLSAGQYQHPGGQLPGAVTASSLVASSHHKMLVRDNRNLYTIYQKLLTLSEDEARRRGMEWILGFPNQFSLPTFLDAGYALLSQLDLALLPLKVGRMAAFLANRPLLGLLGMVDPAASLFRWLCQSSTKSPDLTLSQEERFPSEAIATDLFSQDKAADWYNWRLFSPEMSYENCFCRRDERVCGYIFWKTSVSVNRARGTKVLCTKLVDMWVDEGGDAAAVAAALVRKMVQSAIHADSAFVITTLKTTAAYRSHLRRCGFLFVPPRVSPKPMPVIFKPLGSRAAPPAIERWHVTMVDNDIV